MKQPSQSLSQRLAACAALWAEANEATLARLGRRVVNDSAFFTRLDQPGASTTTATLERFARFLSDPDHWPADHAIPAEVCQFATITGVHLPMGSGIAARPSNGQASAMSAQTSAAA